MFKNSFSANRASYDRMWKQHGTARQAVDNEITQGKKKMQIACRITTARIHTHTLVYLKHCLYTTTLVKRTRRNITSYVHRLYCYLSRTNTRRQKAIFFIQRSRLIHTSVLNKSTRHIGLQKFTYFNLRN
jgi:hypothetical protein